MYLKERIKKERGRRSMGEMKESGKIKNKV